MKPFVCFLLLAFWFESSPAQMVNVPINTAYGLQGQPSISISPTFDWLLCATWLRVDPPIFPSLLPTLYVGWAISDDGGQYWGSIHDYLSIHGAESAVRFDRHGPYETSVHTAFSEYRLQDGRYGRIYHTLLEDFIVWRQPVQVSNSNIDQRDPKVAIDNNPGSNYEDRVYVTWSDFWSRILFKYSSNRGSTWSSQIVITAIGDNEGPDAASWYLSGEGEIKEAGTVRFPDVTVAPNGDVYVAWFEFDFQGAYTGRIPIRRSTDGGNSFQNAVIAGNNVQLGVCFVGNARPYIRPSLAASPNGSLFMVTCDAKTINDGDPYLRLFRSVDNGASWTETWNLLSPTDQQDYFPQVAVTPDERVNVTFMHSTTAYDNCDFDYGPNTTAAWVVTSYDNGSTFGTPRQISSSFSPNSGEMLYYDADAAPSYTDDAVFSVWTDHRDNHPAPYFADINTPPAPPQNVQVIATPPDQFGYRYPRVSWSANTEQDLGGYELSRRVTGVCGNGTWSVIASSLSSSTTEYTDGIPTAGMGSDCLAQYRLRAKDVANNLSDYSATVQIGYSSLFFKIGAGENENIPSKYALHEPYPNPFNPSTEIKFDLPDAGFVSLDVYDLLGRKASELVNGHRGAGYHSATWSASAQASGVYFARVTVSNESGRVQYTKMSKLVLLK